jgi:hypothetical protein
MIGTSFVALAIGFRQPSTDRNPAGEAASNGPPPQRRQRYTDFSESRKTLDLANKFARGAKSPAGFFVRGTRSAAGFLFHQQHRREPAGMGARSARRRG